MLFSMGLVWLQEQAPAFGFLSCQEVLSMQPTHSSCCGMYGYAVIWPEALTTGQIGEAAALELLPLKR